MEMEINWQCISSSDMTLSGVTAGRSSTRREQRWSQRTRLLLEKEIDDMSLMMGWEKEELRCVVV